MKTRSQTKAQCGEADNASRTSHSTRVSGRTTLSARKAAEARHLRRLADLEEQLAETKKKALEAEYEAELAAIGSTAGSIAVDPVVVIDTTNPQLPATEPTPLPPNEPSSPANRPLPLTHTNLVNQVPLSPGDGPGRFTDWLCDVQREWEANDAPPPPPQPTNVHPDSNSSVLALAQAIASLTREQITAATRKPAVVSSLPTFAGNPHEWLAFKRQYDDTKNYFSPTENLNRLRLSLHNEAREAVASLLYTAEDPTCIIDTLRMRFARPEIIINYELNILKISPKLNSEFFGRDLNILACKLNNFLATINFMKEFGYLFSPELFQCILGKLTPLLLARWQDYAADYEAAHPLAPRLEVLGKFLTREADRRLRFGPTQPFSFSPPTFPREGTSGFIPPRPSPAVGLSNPKQPNIPAAEIISCLYCKKAHSVKVCDKFTALSVDDRWQWVMNHKVCARCLKDNHRWRTCKAKPCSLCKKPHHRLLHKERPVQHERPMQPCHNTTTIPTSSSSQPIPSQSGTTSAAVSPSLPSATANPVYTTNIPSFQAVYLKIVPITLFGPKASVDTYALLDDGSTATLMDTDIAKQIGAEGTPTEISLEGVTGTKSSIKSFIFSVELKGKHSSDIISLTNVHTVPNLTLTTQSIKHQDIDKLNYLSDLFPQISYVSATPKVLIGANNWHALLSTENRIGTLSQPIASKTKLGWVLFGGNTKVNLEPYLINNVTLQTFDDTKLDVLIRDYYKLESLGVCKADPYTESEKRALHILNETTRRLPNGRFEVGLLWRSNVFDTGLRILGMFWLPKSDNFMFKSSITQNSIKLTRRSVLSDLMKIFDKLGILIPLTIHGRILFQQTWRTTKSWDEELSPSECRQWRGWYEALTNIESLKVPRCYFLSGALARLELHTFCDASDSAYAAVAYWRSIYECGRSELSLVSSKARVAPNKPTSIPRLELQGALLAARLADTICRAHRRKVNKRVFWCDSKTALAWIRADARSFKPFVAHRVGEITELTVISEWRWVPTVLNVADEATKLKAGIVSDRWLNGPKFLNSDNSWPFEEGIDNESLNSYPEELRNFVGLIVEPAEPLHIPLPDVKRFSSWSRFLRSTAYVYKFGALLLQRRRRNAAGATSVPLVDDVTLSCDDLQLSEQMIWRQVQRKTFPEEYEILRRSSSLPLKCNIRILNPYIDEEQLLRMRGRIDNVNNVQIVKHPLILPGRDTTVRLYIKYLHDKFGHGNNETVLNECRQRFWVIGLRNVIRSVAHQCTFCRRRKASTAHIPPEGTLPTERLDHHTRPFTHVGLDYFGPLMVTIGRRHEKRWVALFTCMSTRAVHLEVVNELTTDAAINTLRRFIARRGRPTTITSDNATAFHGAANELRRALLEEQSEFSTQRGIIWKNIPPGAPSMGGAWERLIGSVKRSLAVILNQNTPKEWTLVTLLAEVEIILNSRPLTYVPTEPGSEEALTPYHFLIGASSVDAPVGRCDPSDQFGRREWRKSQAMATQFWNRWVREYLPQLRRHHFTGARTEIEVGDLVLVADPNMPRNVWPLGRVTQKLTGRDGIVRVVDVRTQGGVLRRPMRKIVPLPIR